MQYTRVKIRLDYKYAIIHFNNAQRRDMYSPNIYAFTNLKDF
ncbi:MAG: hypothetical protein ACI93P_000589 [bacterium]|jgi:hypothetical protein